jgi:small GTP-binding protein
MEPKVYNILVVGEPGVGKSSLIKKWTHTNYCPTSGIIFSSIITYNNFQIRFIDLSKNSYHLINYLSIDGAFYVSDKTNLLTFYLNTNICRQLRTKNIPIILLVNKSELPDNIDTSVENFLEMMPKEKNVKK